jgi:hypothetical protein
VAREFYLRHHWLDITQASTRNAFWFICFAPVALQILFWTWLQRKIKNRAVQN